MIKKLMQALTIDKETIKKFDKPGPRYTSYPTAPVWSEEVNESVYIDRLKQLAKTNKSLSLYFHIPFCQSMCTYCACNVIIRRHEAHYGDEYVGHLLKEIDLVIKHLGTKKPIKQLHWGGGTPTFLTENQIETLFKKIDNCFSIDFSGEIAIEIDPRTTDQNKIKKLRELGFNRISFGVQDFDKQVQKSINRIQSFNLVREVYDYCRQINFSSINFDLIYGLPNQTQKSFSETVENVISLRPDRIALYSFAYVPWIKRHQQKIDTQTLPTSDTKLDLFLNSRAQFLSAGYQAIAMDHFALEDDELARSFNRGQLHRNFMGYTVKPADEYLGFGLTSIGFMEDIFVQNHKILKDYYGLLKEGHLPVERGKILSLDDKIRRWVIQSFMCQFQVNKEDFKNTFHTDFDAYFGGEQNKINEYLDQELIWEENGAIRVTNLGKLFIRNICMIFDSYLTNGQPPSRFSRTI